MMLLVLLLLAAVCSAQDGPLVDTIYGTIEGSIETTESGAAYEMYSGVPFATPPLGELRFAKSIPPEPWDGILDTTEFAMGCIETNNDTETSEDCLYLEIYVPGQNRSGYGLAVMVYVYGGGYYIGTSSIYPGQDLAVHGDLIIVTVNYRLGPLGFLSTEDEAAPGNYGLWDVKLALEWVRDNIAAFGGSPDRVTVFGQSAGGAITSHVMISPETQGLLQRGICISGTSSNLAFGTAVSGSVAQSTNILGQLLGCPDLNDSYALLECLRHENPYDINYWGFVGAILLSEAHYYMPVIDGEFIPQHPAITWNQTAPSDLELMTGSVINDGAANVLFQSQDSPNITTNFAATKESTDTILRFTFSSYPGDYEEIKAAMINQYPSIDNNDTYIRTQAVERLYTDFYFDYGPHYEASHHSIVPVATYMYEYAYTNSFIAPYIDDEYDWFIAEHLEDLFSIFGEQTAKAYVENVLNGEFSEEDKHMSSEVMSYFTNFAKNGNPNEGLEVPVFWPQYTRESREFLQFSENTEVLVETEEKLDNYRFWVEEFPLVAVPGDFSHSTIELTNHQQKRVLNGDFSKYLPHDNILKRF